MSDDVKAFAAAVVAEFREWVAEWEELRAQADSREGAKSFAASAWAIRWAAATVLLRAGLLNEAAEMLGRL